jgi:hypothetical protein
MSEKPAIYRVPGQKVVRLPVSKTYRLDGDESPSYGPEAAEVGMPIRKFISSGQTGVDRAALDVAIALGISYWRLVPERPAG